LRHHYTDVHLSNSERFCGEEILEVVTYEDAGAETASLLVGATEILGDGGLDAEVTGAVGGGTGYHQFIKASSSREKSHACDETGYCRATV
jgi:hypothetical protein